MARVATLTVHALRVRRHTLIGWSVSLALTMIAFVAMFPSIENIKLDALSQQYPEQVLKAFGIESLDGLSTAIGFLKLELFGLILPLTIAFLPLGVFVRAIAGAEERRYLTPLLALPLRRGQLFWSAAVAALASLAIAIASIALSSWLTALIGGIELSFGDILETSVCTAPIALTTTAFAAIACGASGRRGLATAVAGGLLVLMYLVSLLAALVPSIANVGKLSPFHYYTNWINDSIVWWQVAAISGIAFVLIAVGAVLYERRDVRN
ncbi:MAG: ABC transporter permease subunit [Solirubrobacterales bacterium]